MINTKENKKTSFPRYLIILSIPLGLFIALFLGYLNFYPLKVELHSLIIVFIILIIFMTFIVHNAWYVFSSYKKSLNQTIENVENYLHENELIINGKKKSIGDINGFFDNSLKNIRNDNFANIASSVFPTLGILGTFIAIAISMPNFTVESKAALENEITILLNGVGTAFYASIYGIFLSIWWIFFEKRGVSKIFLQVDKIKSSYDDFIWKKEELELHKMLESKYINEKFIQKIESVMTPEYIYKLDLVAREKLKQIEILSEKYKTNENRLNESYITLIKLFEDAKHKQNSILDDFGSLYSNMKKTTDSLSKLVENQELNTKAVKQEIYSVLSSFELVSKDLKSLGRSLIEKEIEK